MLCQLFPGQPLEILEAESIGLQVCLSSHNPRLHEESLLASFGNLLLCVVVWFDGMMSDWCISYNPGVHVDTGCLNNDSLSSLDFISMSQFKS